jgi:peptide deformylase
LSANEDPYAAEFRRWLEIRGYSKTALAKATGFTRPYVSKIASGAERGSVEFARAADKEMRTGGVLERAWREHHGKAPAPVPEHPAAVAGGLTVDQDLAELHYEGGVYRLTQRRRLINTGNEPVLRYLIRIAVDKYPGEPERSNQLYREHPLTWEELGLQAWYGEDRGEPLTWTVQHDRDAFKELWLILRGRDGRRLPLYPGEAGWIEYTYTVPATKWGNWYRRAVRLPTNHLAVALDLPTNTEPEVWGTHTSLTGDDLPLPTPVAVERTDDRIRYSWSTNDPPLHARYTLQWRWGTAPYDEPMQQRPSEVMAVLGIVQDPDPGLRRIAKQFNLPGEAEHARITIARLRQAADLVATAHDFSGKGRGLAAPQIGLDAAAAVVYPPGAAEPIVLLNPTVVESSAETDMQYEGCLSFFDTRSRIPRPLSVHIEHTDLGGQQRITVFEHGLARLVLHEVDHLHGILCSDHLPEGTAPTPVEEYRGTGSAWTYRG